MSGSNGTLAPHVPQSLPSFATMFNSHSLGNAPGSNALPPIQSRLPGDRRVHSPSHSRPGSEEKADLKMAGRKRYHKDMASSAREEEQSDSERASPIIRIKEEQDQDMLDPVPPSPPDRLHDRELQTSGAPPPSSVLPSPLKKRRVTISGAPHPLNTDVRIPPDQTNSTPISPVVMGFPVKRDNPSQIEQLRSMITVKQKQKALIEQRRGSIASVTPINPGPVNPPATPVDERAPSSSKTPNNSTRHSRRSPNPASTARRSNVASQGVGNTRPPSPTPLIVPSQQPLHVPGQQPAIPVPNQSTPAHSLAPPPISFARRRAAQLGGKKKPADILISPRDAQTPEQLQPAIQSAPPVQGSFYSGRFPMALPRLPSVMGGGDNIRRVAGNVPPTPTRLSMQRSATSLLPSNPVVGLSGRSPPAASVPISSTLVPPTPASLHHPGYSGDKSAFLAPFEVFYDALNDSKQLKTWLGDQLQKSNALVQMLTQQQEKLNETVENLVDKKTSALRGEVSNLRRRVDELEDALRSANPRHDGQSYLSLRNGLYSDSSAPESYTFPPSSTTEASRIRLEPSSNWGQERDVRSVQHVSDSGNGSPAPFDARRHSVSTLRLEQSRSQRSPSTEFQQPRSSHPMQSPPQNFRDSPNTTLSPPIIHSKSARGGKKEREHPSMSRQASYSNNSNNAPREHTSSPAPPRRSGSRRNSIVMASADDRGEDS